MMYPHTFRTEHTETRTTSSMYGEHYEKLKKKVRVQPTLLKILQSIDAKKKMFIKNLEEIIGIRSISGKLNYIDEIEKAIKFIEGWMLKLGIKYERFDIGTYTLEDKKLTRPTVILAYLGRDTNKPTIGVYAHLDVKKPVKEQWKTDPWTVTEIDKRLYGCGVASGKGTLTAWFNLILAFQDIQMSLPVNLKFIIQSLHYYNSDGFEEFVAQKRKSFLKNIDCYVVCDSEWVGEKHPCIVYGSVGFLHFTCTMDQNEKASTSMQEEMDKIFNKLHDGKGNVLIPEFNKFVKQITPDEEKVYSHRNFKKVIFQESLPDHQKSWNKLKLLMRFWRIPSILVEDILECDCDKGAKTRIKRKFLVKIVPKQVIDVSTCQIMQHLKKTCKELHVKHKFEVKLKSASRTWSEDIWSINYVAARLAVFQIYKEDPNLIREDRDLPVVNILSVATEKNILVLPLGDKHIRAGESNESIHKKHFYEGIKVLGAYLFQVAALLKEQTT
ncbi:hypothetical protein FQR65_LT02662 [Abscondita terminalis]|nr:hypothetical protein FQR65_LT02662 [Abscondita terminalis]